MEGFTAGQLTGLGALLTPLLGTIGTLFWVAIGSKNSEINTLKDGMSKLLSANEKLSDAIDKHSEEMRELRLELWKQQQGGGGGRKARA